MRDDKHLIQNAIMLPTWTG